MSRYSQRRAKALHDPAVASGYQATTRRRTITDDEHDLLMALSALGYPSPQGEVRFHPTRRWRLDWAWTRGKVAVEIDGGSWIGGAHNSPRGRERDAIKDAEAQLLGWLIIHCTAAMLRSGVALDLIERALALRGLGRRESA